ncbi:PepSY-associated TM helix domain-containing protein [Robbsia sp. KACC 23696]|uniref:PepSY-associated TM helix domain-containing protein n=1 Tax=Robbsia sp. KACC 23696 TaxID=3149231 RepID=UPI00325B8151
MHTATTAPRVRPASKGSARSRFLKWLRRIHGWLGLWGAIAGLLFGLTGIFQNHRAVMRIPLPPPTRSSVQLTVPPEAQQSPKAMAAWLRQSLKLSHAPARVSREPAQAVAWGDETVQQPEHWQIRFSGPNTLLDAEYWAGASDVKVTRVEHNIIGVIENLHRSNGMSPVWILLADTFGGAMILLSITGVILWSELNKRRLIGFTIFAASTIAILSAAASSF